MDVYNVDSYSDTDLFKILDLINPTDRELEAKILFFIKKYQETMSADSIKLAQFFKDIHSRFFEEFTEDAEEFTENIEGFEGINFTPVNKRPKAFTESQTPNVNELTYINPLPYAPNKLNPLLKQTIKRLVVVDSTFREWKGTTSIGEKSYSTNFNVNFSEVLKDVVSLTLTSFQIPYSWYTINNDYGSNFFYIKGNSPGINDGNHDFKISVTPGNYTAIELNTAISQNIDELKNNNKDIYFNSTDICYNVNTCKSTLNIGITNIYDYSNYTFSFGNWLVPWYDAIDATYGNRKKNISAFLGFNYANYSTNSIYSYRTISQSILNTNINNNMIDETNNTIKIVQYWNDDSFSIVDYSNNSQNIQKYNTIILTLNTSSKISATQILNDINYQMKSSSFLDSSSDISFVPITDSSLNNYGNSYFKWTIKLNRSKTVNQLNSRIVVILPNIPDDNIWVGRTSIFGFPSYINEMNNLIAETPVINQSYKFDGVSIFLKCILPGYDLSTNDISYAFPNNFYSLNNFMYNTNLYLFQNVGNASDTKSDYVLRTDGKKTDLTNSSVSLDTNSYLNIKLDVIATIYGNQFSYDISNSFLNIPGEFIETKIDVNPVITSDFIENEEVVYKKIYSGTLINIFSSFNFSKGSSLITINSNDSKYMKSNVSYNVLTTTSSSGGIQGLQDYINSLLNNYSDSSGSYPLNRSSIVFQQNSTNTSYYDYSMTIIVKKILTESDYVLNLYDEGNMKGNTITESTFFSRYNLQSDELIYKTDFRINSYPQTAIFNPSINVYDISSSSLIFNCITPGYNTSNNFRIDVNKSNTPYTLSYFSETINDFVTSNAITNASANASISGNLNYFDISGTKITISNEIMILDISINRHLNKITDFSFDQGDLLTLLNTDGSYNTNFVKTFTGKLEFKSYYNFTSITNLMNVKSSNLFLMTDVCFNIVAQSNISSYNGMNLLTTIENLVKNYSDANGSTPFSKSYLLKNEVYTASDFTYLLDWTKWSTQSNNPNAINTTKSKFIFNSNYQLLTTDLININLGEGSATIDISLSFVVSYDSSNANEFQIISNNNVINVNGTLYTGTANINNNGTYNVHMNVFSGNSIIFKLASTGNTRVEIKNVNYSYASDAKKPVYYDWSLNVIIDKVLTNDDYSVELLDIHFGDSSNSLWYDFSNNSKNITPISTYIPYTLSKYYNQSINSSLFLSKDKIALDTITLTGKSNILYLKPYTDGVYDYLFRNDLSFNIPAKTYNSTEDLLNTINALFNANPITTGTIISVLSNGYCQIRWNINKVYRTQDYTLVFYDTTSFVKCFIGNTSYRNSSPDSTLGWILGFHSSTEYFLQGQFYSSGYYVDLTLQPTKNLYNITYVNGVSGDVQEITITGDNIVNVDLYKYLMIILDDYTQNHLNDGLVTIAQKDTSLVLPSYASRAKYECDPITGKAVNTGIASGTNNLTQNQLYSINEIINAQNTKISLVSAGPFVKDVFAMIPLDIGGLTAGQKFIEKATGIQDRVYFGPVNIHKLAVKLINDKGDVLDLNDSDWSFQLLCEQLYQISPNSDKT